MLFVKFYTSVFMLHSICCKYHLKMFMLLLHISTLCDIICKHLFESYPKIDKIQVERDTQIYIPTTMHTQSTTLDTSKMK